MILTLDLPVFVTAIGMIRLLPTWTVPKVTLETESDIWAEATPETSEKSERTVTTKYAYRRGSPKQLISLLSFARARCAEHGRGISELWFMRPNRTAHALLVALFFLEEFLVGHQSTMPSVP